MRFKKIAVRLVEERKASFMRIAEIKYGSKIYLQSKMLTANESKSPSKFISLKLLYEIHLISAFSRLSI